MALTLVISYDVSDNRTRTKISNMLRTWGDRVQKSVYACTVEPPELPVLRRRLLNLIDGDTDSILFFRQCRACLESVEVLGQASVPGEQPACWTA
jgi:CRISPR-associated protein Cas2